MKYAPYDEKKGNFAHVNREQQNARWGSTKLVIYNVNTCIDCYE